MKFERSISSLPGAKRPRVLIAPDKFKGSLSARDAAAAIERGLRSARPDLSCITCPVADGGEGTVAAVLADSSWSARVVRVSGPLDARSVAATMALRETTVVCEMASASGFEFLAPGDTRGARSGTSFGTGQLIGAALDLGATHIVLGVGGSATNDAGAGALVALGARLLGEGGEPLPFGGAALAEIASVDLRELDPRLQTCTLELITDVETTLLGANGASAVFGPQKGATPSDVAFLDAALGRFAGALIAAGGIDSRELAGTGAGGGIAFACTAVARALVARGFAVVAEMTGFTRALETATACVTGEGSIDAQTLCGKAVDGVTRAAFERGIPAYAFGGRVDPGTARTLERRGCRALAIAPASVPAAVAMRDAATLLEAAARRLAADLPS